MKINKRFELTKKRYPTTTITPEMLCPKWNYCSCNRCILHKDYKKLEVHQSDKIQKCKCPKTIRKQIGVFFKLKNQGLTEREISGSKRWDSLSEEEKAIKTAKMKEISLFYRLKKKGYGISRLKSSCAGNTQTNPEKSLKNAIVGGNND